MSVAAMHDHAHGGEPGRLAPQASSASVALDIGAGRGALVIYPSERFHDREIEISRAGTGAARVHTGVHERPTAAGARLTAIFGSLAEGDYLVWAGEETIGATVTVCSGSVTECALD